VQRQRTFEIRRQRQGPPRPVAVAAALAAFAAAPVAPAATPAALAAFTLAAFAFALLVAVVAALALGPRRGIGACRPGIVSECKFKERRSDS